MVANDKPQYIPHLKYWVQLVTPLVYDDSLSLYETMRKVVYKLNQVIDIVNPLGAGIEDTIKEYLEKYHVEWEAELDEWKQQMLEIINNNNTTINNRIDNLTEDLNNKQNIFENEMQNKYDNLSKELMEKVATLAITIHDTDSANRIWTMALFESLKKDLTGNFPPVIDPTDGKLESIQTALNHMWDTWRTNAITAEEYDSLELTAQEYDNKELTANSYDNYGKILLMPSSALLKNDSEDVVYVSGVPIKKSAIAYERMV